MRSFRSQKSILGYRRGITATESSIVLMAIVVVLTIAGFATSNKLRLVYEKIAQLQPATAPDQPVTTATPAATSSPLFESLVKLARDDFYELALVAGLLILCVVLGYYAFRWKRKPTQLSLYEDEVVDETQLTTLPTALFEKRQKLFRRLTCLAEAGDLHDVRVRLLMSLAPNTVLPTTPVAEIVRSMQEHRFRHILVADEAQNLMGIISDRDVSRREGTTAEEIMTARITVVDPDSEVIPAVTTMLNLGVSALPVVSNGKLVGILTTTDIMLIMQCMILIGHRQAEELAIAASQHGPLEKSVPVAPGVA